MGEKIPLQELDELILSLPDGKRKQFAVSQRTEILESDSREYDAASRPRLEAAGLNAVIGVKEGEGGKVLPGQLREGVAVTDIVATQRQLTDKRVRDLLEELETMQD